MGKWQLEYRTGTGLRTTNEDRYLAQVFDENRILLTVCDGMGGHDHGETAAELAIRTIKIFFITHIFRKKDDSYCQKLINHIEQTFTAFINEKPSYKGMGTTMALVYIEGGHACILWAGDSRIYVFRENRVLFRSNDHNLASELVKQGKIRHDSLEYYHNKNYLTNCIMGTHRPSGHDFSSIEPVKKGDVFFLCTDGLTDVLSDTTLESAIARYPLHEAAEYFEEECRERSNDNYTFILLKV
jgi:protein phosphatase